MSKKEIKQATPEDIKVFLEGQDPEKIYCSRRVTPNWGLVGR
jgi:hypothetical protein